MDKNKGFYESQEPLKQINQTREEEWGNWMIAGQSEAQLMQPGVCNQHLKFGGQGALEDWALICGILFQLQVDRQCWYWIKLDCIQAMPTAGLIAGLVCGNPLPNPTTSGVEVICIVN